mgnify:CR=1 FL=1
MEDLKQINKILRDHEKRIASLENKKILLKKTGSKKSLSDHIIELRDRGAFKKPLTAEEVHKRLVTTYPCDFSRVKVELVRIQGRGQLRKTSKMVGKKKYVAYVW